MRVWEKYLRFLGMCLVCEAVVLWSLRIILRSEPRVDWVHLESAGP